MYSIPILEGFERVGGGVKRGVVHVVAAVLVVHRVPGHLQEVYVQRERNTHTHIHRESMCVCDKEREREREWHSLVVLWWIGTYLMCRGSI